MKPYFAVYSTFLQRAYDEIIHDTAIAKLPVRFLVDRAGIVGDDGETHQGLFDVSFMKTIPEMTIYSPASYDELCGCLEASLECDKPLAIRYPRGGEEVAFKYFPNDFTVYGNGGDIALVSYGIISADAVKAVAALLKAGLKVDFIKLNKIFPIGNELINTLEGYKKVYIFEEGIITGGISEHIAARCDTPCRITAFRQGFIPAAPRKDALREAMLDTEGMIRIIGSENL